MESQSFAQQLIAARKAAGMTQEQLGERLHMSRQGVSHWETGRALPDAEMVRRLSQVLHYDFVTSQALAEASAPAAEAPVTSGRPIWRQPVMWLSVAVVLLAAAVVALLLRPVGTLDGSAPQTETGVAAPAVAATRAEVRIIPAQSPLAPTLDASLGPTPWWIYRLTLQETAGVDFTVEKASVILTCADGRVTVAEYGGEYFAANIGSGSNVLRAGVNVQWNGAEPLTDLSSITVRLDGTDALGNVLRFERVMECRRPEAPQASVPAGRAALTVQAQVEQASPVVMDELGPEPMWMVCFDIRAGGDTPVTLRRVTVTAERAGSVAWEDTFDEAQIIADFGDSVIPAGSVLPWYVGNNVCDLTGFTVRVEAVDGQGNVLTAQDSVALLQE